MNGQANLWDLHVLLQMEKGKLELGKLLLGDRDTHLRLGSLLSRLRVTFWSRSL